MRFFPICTVNICLVSRYVNAFFCVCLRNDECDARWKSIRNSWEIICTGFVGVEEEEDKFQFCQSINLDLTQTWMLLDGEKVRKLKKAGFDTIKKGFFFNFE